MLAYIPVTARNAEIIGVKVAAARSILATVALAHRRKPQPPVMFPIFQANPDGTRQSIQVVVKKMMQTFSAEADRSQLDLPRTTQTLLHMIHAELQNNNREFLDELVREYRLLDGVASRGFLRGMEVTARDAAAGGTARAAGLKEDFLIRLFRSDFVARSAAPSHFEPLVQLVTDAVKVTEPTEALLDVLVEAAQLLVAKARAAGAAADKVEVVFGRGVDAFFRRCHAKLSVNVTLRLRLLEVLVSRLTQE